MLHLFSLQKSVVQLHKEFSVTRFGEISVLGHNFMNLCELVVGVLSVCQNFESTFENFYESVSKG